LPIEDGALIANSQQIRSERHSEVGILIQENAETLVDLWSERAVREQPRAERVHHSVLQNHLRDFLRKLGASLAESDDLKTGQHCLPASIHGEQRWHAGWSLSEVVRDYQILRLVVVDFVEESLDRRLGHREALAIGLALDEAIAASVLTYTNDRDLHIKQLEEKKAEELKQAQERLQRHADSLIDADRRKNEFLAMLAHELRNPLAPIRNAIEILRLKAPPDSDVKWARDLIQRQVQHMTRMVDDLLDVSRVTRGKVNLQKEPVQIGVIVARSVEEVRPLIEGRRQKLQLNVPPESLWISGDPTRLCQVFVNLLNNASKFTDEGGEIHLAVTREDAEIAVCVRDTGLGIPNELLPHIFEPFMQEDRLQSRSKGGLGLGLALSRSLLDLHGGRIRAFSDGHGAGSQFVVNLPVLDVQSSAEEKKAPPPAPTSRKRRILVVDDNKDAVHSLKILLEFFGHEVRLAYGGQQALDEASAWPPEIVLLDIGLPTMDGLEVARRFRANPTFANVLVVAITGYGQDEDRRRSQEAGFDAHLVKPIDLRALQEIVAAFSFPGSSAASISA
jgi:signal transduction histidine kinase/ActR/RegA family two-component response regulator